MNKQLMLKRFGMMLGNNAEVEDKYLTFTAKQANSTISMQADADAPQLSLEYSVDDGASWNTFVVGVTSAITLSNIGDTVKFRGINNRTSIADNKSNYFVMSGEIDGSGYVTSILNNIGGYVTLEYAATEAHTFRQLFKNCSALKSSPNIGLTNTFTSSCQDMYNGCTGLTNIPELPTSITGGNSCMRMFAGCTGLTSVELNYNGAIPSNGYMNMFQNCSNLSYVKTFMTDISASGAVTNWLYSVAASGTLVCDKSLVLSEGVSGLPSGWTRYNLDGTSWTDPNAE